MRDEVIVFDLDGFSVGEGAGYTSAVECKCVIDENFEAAV